METPLLLDSVGHHATTWAMSIYDLIVWAYYAVHARRLPDPARYVLTNADWLSKKATVLDYGGGRGRWAVRLAERAALVVVAEIDEQALHKVPAHPRLRSVLLDGVRLPFRPGAFDLVFVNHVLHHVENLQNLAPELRRVVRPGGHLVVIEFDPRASVTRIYRFLSRYRKHPCTFYTPHGLARLLGGEILTVDNRKLDDFQYVLVASRPRNGQPSIARSAAS
jgi:SAM-dependent methyltransferase